MSLSLSIILLILSLLGCMILKADLVYGLLIGMLAFMAAASHAGFHLKDILRMMWNGIRESFIVVGVLLIIGAMTGAWRGSGTIQQLVGNDPSQAVHSVFISSADGCLIPYRDQLRNSRLNRSSDDDTLPSERG